MYYLLLCRCRCLDYALPPEAFLAHKGDAGAAGAAPAVVARGGRGPPGLGATLMVVVVAWWGNTEISDSPEAGRAISTPRGGGRSQPQPAYRGHAHVHGVVVHRPSAVLPARVWYAAHNVAAG